jgi:hypothetical protein
MVVGHRGRLADALRRSASSQKLELKFLTQDIQIERPGFLNILQERVRNTLVGRESKKTTLLMLSAIVDPSQPKSLVAKANLEIPKRLFDYVLNLGLTPKMVTIGSVMERLTAGNEYIASKQELSNWLIENLDQDDFAHIRFPTLVGATPPPRHMFLFQLAAAVANQSEFRMSRGNQYRQYLRYSDAAKIVFDSILKANLDCLQGVIEPPCPTPVKLRSVAIEAKRSLYPSLKLVFDKELDPVRDFYSLNELINGRQQLASGSLDIALSAIKQWLKNNLI